ncbi:MAG: peptidylprolyl isomerase [Rhizobiaceae bacterium]|nr:MAG: peptidylprolyl isomerase [Rhizobiaceae bacterium]
MRVFPIWLFMAMLVLVPFMSAPAHADEVKVIVNGVPITNTDIAHRAAFLKLQRRKGISAKEDMVEQVLRSSEERRLGINITDKQVDEAYAGFGKKNKLTPKQLDMILAHAGVTSAHFKQFLRVQLGWGEALRARFRAQSGAETADIVRQMLEKGEKKPSAMQYTLQQVIFVIPQRDWKAIFAKRKREAEAMRAKFNGCATTRASMKGLIDVTVRDLGQVLAPELPTDWADDIKKTKVGSTTPLHTTKRGLEYIGICSGKEVSDDRVAELVLESGKDQNKMAKELNDKYIAELKKKARIIER